MSKKRASKKQAYKKMKYRIRYDIGAFLFGLFGLAGVFIPFPVLIEKWMGYMDIQSYTDQFIYYTLATVIYNFWIVALWLGWLGEKAKQRTGLLILGILLGLLDCVVVILRGFMN